MFSKFGFNSFRELVNDKIFKVDTKTKDNTEINKKIEEAKNENLNNDSIFNNFGVSSFGELIYNRIFKEIDTKETYDKEDIYVSTDILNFNENEVLSNRSVRSLDQLTIKNVYTHIILPSIGRIQESMTYTKGVLNNISTLVLGRLQPLATDIQKKAESLFFVGDYFKFVRENGRIASGLTFVWGVTILGAAMQSPVLTALMGAVAAKCTNGALINETTSKKAAILGIVLIVAFVAEQILRKTAFAHISFLSMGIMLGVEFTNRVIKDALSDYAVVQILETNITEGKTEAKKDKSSKEKKEDKALENTLPVENIVINNQDVEQPIQVDVKEQVSSIREIWQDTLSTIEKTKAWLLEEAVVDEEITTETTTVQKWVLTEGMTKEEAKAQNLTAVVEGDRVYIKKTFNKETKTLTIIKSPSRLKHITIVGLATAVGGFGMIINNSLSQWAFAKLTNLAWVRALKDRTFIVKYGAVAGLILGAYGMKDFNPALWQKYFGLGTSLFKRDVNNNMGINMDIYEDDEEKQVPTSKAKTEAKEEKPIETIEIKTTDVNTTDNAKLVQEEKVTSLYAQFKTKIGKACQKIADFGASEAHKVKKTVGKVVSGVRDVLHEFVPKKVNDFFTLPNDEGKPAIGRCALEAIGGNAIALGIIRNTSNGTMMNMVGYDFAGIYTAAFLNRFSAITRLVSTGVMAGIAAIVDKALNIEFLLPVVVNKAGEIFRIDLKRWTKADKKLGVNVKKKKKKKEKANAEKKDAKAEKTEKIVNTNENKLN